MKYQSKTGKRAPQRRVAKKSYSNFDGQKLLLSSYAEVILDQPAADADGGVMAYTLACDPKHMNIKLDKTGNGSISASSGDAVIADNAELSFQALTKFEGIYKQYKVDWVKVAITTDRDCGLDNPVVTLTQKGNAASVTSMASTFSQPHKESIFCLNPKGLAPMDGNLPPR